MGYFTKGVRFGGWAFLFGLLLLGIPHGGQAQEHGPRPIPIREFRDMRYQHNRTYPVRGQVFNGLPGGHREIIFGKTRYFFFDGIWYKPVGRRYMVIGPPYGLIVPVLPPVYATVWVGGVPYYYANEVYYAQTPGGYVVVEQPRGEIYPGPLPPGGSPAVTPMPGPAPVTPLPPGPATQATQIFIYPRQGQSPQQQSKDRMECYNWAVSQIGFDPSRPPAGIPEMQRAQMQADFTRAQSACLDGRGYTVR